MILRPENAVQWLSKLAGCLQHSRRVFHPSPFVIVQRVKRWKEYVYVWRKILFRLPIGGLPFLPLCCACGTATDERPINSLRNNSVKTEPHPWSSTAQTSEHVQEFLNVFRSERVILNQ